MRRRRLLTPEERILVALSAGPDSTALVAALAELRDARLLCGRGLHALHVDHGLRADGGADAAAAAATCARLGVPFESVRIRVAPGNVQAEARRGRYAALHDAARRASADRIATGHTRTDQAETVLLRLLRGAGARGLGAIPPRRGVVVRPLIDRPREEGIRYLADRGIPFRVDPSNETPRFARNRLRLSVWPELLKLAPAAERTLARAADLARDDDRALRRRARALVGERGAAAPVSRLLAAPVAVRRRVVRLLWRRAGGRAGDLDARAVDAILTLLRGDRPRRRSLAAGLEARCRYGSLEIAARAAPSAPLPTLDVPAPGRYAVPELGCILEVRAVRAEQVPWPLAARSRRPGDRFRPDGGRGSKLLRRWMIDRKVPRERRDGLLVLAAGDRVLAVPELEVIAAGEGAAAAGLAARLHAAR